MLSSLTVAVRTSPPTMPRVQDPSTSAASSPPLSSSLASHCRSYSRIRKSLNLVRASCRSLVAGTSPAGSATSVLSILTTPTPSHAVSCMGPSWPILQLSDKRILITSSLNVTPFLSPEASLYQIVIWHYTAPPTCFYLCLITSLWAVRQPFD